ncbi:Tn3 family transposase [Saccharomonospora azurea]|uniref:Transposase, TnpA family n=2 Tax=Saccharomonospora TaxID=1851 RepID=H8G9V9_9PSEU|nr:Tn3 family transposase [Saccharomonospora azurea]EHY87515.1 transposase, TnpA family [Saccharomonospora azurea NA-128]
MAAIDRTAYPRFKRVVPARELAEAFTPTIGEITWAREKTQNDPHLLALLVWLKSYQRLGYFPKLDEVPPVVVEHVRGVLELATEVVLEHDADRTAKWHRGLVRSFVGVKYDAARARRVAGEAIRKAVTTKDNPADLINVALEELVRAGCELPGFSTLDRMAAAIRAETNTALYAMVAARIDLAGKARLARLLWLDPTSRRSEFDRLKTPAQAATLGKFKLRLAHLQEVDALGPTERWLDGIPSTKLAHFAGEARVTDVGDMRDIGEAKRLTLLASLIHECRTSARDEVATMFCKRMAVLHKKGRERLAELHEQHRAESERLLDVFGDVLAGAREATAVTEDGTVSPEAAAAVAERVGRLLLKTLTDAGGVEQLSAAHEAVSAHHGNNYLPLLEQFYKSHRSALFTLLDTLELEATSADHSVADAVEFLRAIRGRTGEYVPEKVTVCRGEDAVTVAIDIDFVTEAWRKILVVKDRPGKLVRRHLEVCVFSYLASELRSGDIAVVGANSYANLHAQLMSWDECAPLAEQFCGQAGIPSDPKKLTAHYRAALGDIAAVVDAGFPRNTDLSFADGRPVLRRRKGADRRPSALALEEAIHQRLPERGLLDILARTAHLVGWPRHFGPASGSDPKIRDAMARYVLTVFANGTLLGPAQVARHMRDQVSAHELSIAANKHTTCAKIDAASTDVINEFAKLDVAGMWGDGRVVAVDGTQVDTWENNILAESHIRYGGYGGIAYRHISDTYIALFSRFIPCGVWEAVYIIEGLLRNDSDIQPDTIHADTQGQSLPVFGLAALLGFDLLPRIRNWADLNFYRPSVDTRFEHIDALFGENVIDWGLIETHWPDLLRTAISISEGRLSSVTLLRRLGNNSRKNRLYRAFRELGRVIRTITLLRFLADAQLREQITAITNKAEAFHGFSAWLRFGGEAIGRNDPDYQEKIIKFNELLANCVIYSNACDITAAANALAADGHPIDTDDLATISPYITHTIRRFGDWVLDLSTPDAVPVTTLDLVPGALFPGDITAAAAPSVTAPRRARQRVTTKKGS